MESVPLVASLLCMLFFGAFFADNKLRDLALFYFFCACMFLLLVIRTRGWDFELYAAMFNDVTVNSVSSSWTEPGFLLAMLLIKNLGGNFFLFNLIYAFSFLVLFSRICKWVSFSLCFAALLYFCFHYFRGPYGQLRQCLSVLLFIYALRYINTRPFLYFSINAGAVFFHGLSLIAFPFYFVSRLIMWDARIGWAVLVILGVVARVVVLPHLLEVNYDVSVLNKLKYYLSLGDEKTVLYLSLELPKVIFVITAMFVFFPRRSELNSLEKTLGLCYLFGVYLYIVLSVDLRLASRLASPFLTVDFLVLANALRYARGLKKIILILFSSFLGIFYLLIELQMMSNSTLKYSW